MKVKFEKKSNSYWWMIERNSDFIFYFFLHLVLQYNLLYITNFFRMQSYTLQVMGSIPPIRGNEIFTFYHATYKTWT